MRPERGKPPGNKILLPQRHRVTEKNRYSSYSIVVRMSPELLTQQQSRQRFPPASPCLSGERMSLAISGFDVIDHHVILMTCAFCRPEDLCNSSCGPHAVGDCIGLPAPKNGAIRMTKRNGIQQFLNRPKSIGTTSTPAQTRLHPR